MDKINQLIQAFRGDDDLGVVLRSQIIVEQYLNELIELLLKSPEHFRKMNLDYSSTVKLAISLGLNSRFESALNTLGKLRNDFAHNIREKISLQDVNNLYASLDKESKATIHEAVGDFEVLPPYKDLEPKDKYISIVTVLTGSLYFAKELVPYQKINADEK